MVRRLRIVTDLRVTGVPTVGMIHARQGEGLNEGKHKRRRQGYDMARGKIHLAGWYPARGRLGQQL